MPIPCIAFKRVANGRTYNKVDGGKTAPEKRCQRYNEAVSFLSHRQNVILQPGITERFMGSLKHKKTTKVFNNEIGVSSNRIC